MIDKSTYTLVNKHSGELAFKLYKFDEMAHFDPVQRLNYYTLVWIKKGKGKAFVDFNEYEYQEKFSFVLTHCLPR